MPRVLDSSFQSFVPIQKGECSCTDKIVVGTLKTIFPALLVTLFGTQRNTLYMSYDNWLGIGNRSAILDLLQILKYQAANFCNSFFFIILSTGNQQTKSLTIIGKTVCLYTDIAASKVKYFLIFPKYLISYIKGIRDIDSSIILANDECSFTKPFMTIHFKNYISIFI